MSAESDKLRILYPEFASVADWPDATVDLFIGWAAAELESSVWRSFFERGALALAAHMMARSKASAAAGGGGLVPVGPVSSIKTGDQQITYGDVGAATGDADADLKSTPYGLEFLRLREQVSGHPLVVM